MAPRSATPTSRCAPQPPPVPPHARRWLRRRAVLFQDLDRSVWLSRLRAEAVDGELRGLIRRHLDMQVVVLLPGRFAFPIQILRVVRRKVLDGGSTGKDRVLLGAPPPKTKYLTPSAWKSSVVCTWPLNTTISRSLAYAASVACGFCTSGIGPIPARQLDRRMETDEHLLG